jgi:hypothetical protein
MKGPQLAFRRYSDNSQSSPEQRQSVGRSQETRGRLYPGGRSRPATHRCRDTHRHRVSISWTRLFFIRAAVNPATGSRSSTRVTENFVADIAIVGGFSYALKAGAQEVDFSARWFHEFAVQNRVRRDLIYANFSFRL